MGIVFHAGLLQHTFLAQVHNAIILVLCVRLALGDKTSQCQCDLCCVDAYFTASSPQPFLISSTNSCFLMLNSKELCKETKHAKIKEKVKL